MDDVMRVADGVKEAQAGHIKLDYALKEKLLTFHRDKSIYMVYGNKKYKDKVDQEMKENPLTLGDIIMKRKRQQKYLGDILDEGGLAASVEATVKNREAKTKAGIYELKAVCHDFRLQLLGGMEGALALWESCILPSLLSNCGTWIGVKEETVKKLDGLQNMFLLALLKMPLSTPHLATRAMTGVLGMQYRIWLEKLNLVAALRKLDENTLAKQVFNDQLELGLPGLVKEVQVISKILNIQDISRIEVTREEIRDALEIHQMKTMREEMGDKAKYRIMKTEDTRKIHSCLKEMNLEECCMAMRIKCFMIDCAGNMAARYRGREECLLCRPRAGKEGPGMIETQDHLEVCEGYGHLRINKDFSNFKDKVKYFQEVVKEREDVFKKIKKAKRKKAKNL